MAERALDHARVVGKNIRALCKGKPPHSIYQPTTAPFMVVSLGPDNAIAFSGGVTIAGGVVTTTFLFSPM